jgi:hypothetical protein
MMDGSVIPLIEFKRYMYYCIHLYIYTNIYIYMHMWNQEIYLYINNIHTNICILIKFIWLNRDISYLSKSLPAPLLPHGFHGYIALQEAARLSDTTLLINMLEVGDVNKVHLYVKIYMDISMYIYIIMLINILEEGDINKVHIYMHVSKYAHICTYTYDYVGKYIRGGGYK